MGIDGVGGAGNLRVLVQVKLLVIASGSLISLFVRNAGSRLESAARQGIFSVPEGIGSSQVLLGRAL